MSITKAVIPCGGLGTRFFPITKAVPKELLPIVDTPSVALIVEEAKNSGITDVLLVLGSDKEAIRQYFSKDCAVLKSLQNSGKQELAEQLKQTDFGVNITYAYQNQPKGSADAVYCAKDFTGDQPFCLAWGDDIITGLPVMGQLINGFSSVNSFIVGVQNYLGDDITKYGVAMLDEINIGLNTQNLKRCAGFLEKPSLKDIPSRYAALGRYVLTSKIYQQIQELKPIGGEFRLTDAINDLCKNDSVFIYDFEGQRFDCGDKLGFIKATLQYALKKDFAPQLKQYLTSLVKSF